MTNKKKAETNPFYKKTLALHQSCQFFRPYRIPKYLKYGRQRKQYVIEAEPFFLLWQKNPYLIWQFFILLCEKFLVICAHFFRISGFVIFENSKIYYRGFPLSTVLRTFPSIRIQNCTKLYKFLGIVRFSKKI